METQMAVTLFLLAVGLAMIIKGGDWFLDSAVWLAESTGVPRFLIGATIVSVATTLPELTVSVIGVLQDEVDLAVGNAVGSVTANLGLILGVSLLCLPAAIRRGQLAGKVLTMLLAGVVLLRLCRDGAVRMGQAWILLVLFLAYMAGNLREARGGTAGQHPAIRSGETLRRMAQFAVGLTGIIGGSRLLIRYGSILARDLGVPESVIGVTLVAVGTSLPELVTALSAIAKGEASLSVGNILGANIIDLTLILPVCTVLGGGRLSVARQTTALDLPALLVLGSVAFFPALITGRFRRWQGAALLALYAGYIARLIL